MEKREGNGWREKGSMSPTFHQQVLQVKIPKAQKRLTAWLYFLHFLESAGIKAVHKMLVKLTQDIFLNVDWGRRERESCAPKVRKLSCSRTLEKKISVDFLWISDNLPWHAFHWKIVLCLKQSKDPLPNPNPN
jgi:hypothetical protein